MISEVQTFFQYVGWNIKNANSERDTAEYQRWSSRGQ